MHPGKHRLEHDKARNSDKQRGKDRDDASLGNVSQQPRAYLRGRYAASEHAVALSLRSAFPVGSKCNIACDKGAPSGQGRRSLLDA